MREIALHLMDIAMNSHNAGAGRIRISVSVDRENDMLYTSVRDDGAGMDDETLSRCTDPFMSTQTGKRIGLGLSLYRLSACRSGGSFSIKSELGRGTEVSASYSLTHVDTPPLGDMAETMAALMCIMNDTSFEFTYSSGGRSYVFGTAGRNGTNDIIKSQKRIQKGINKINGGVLPI